ncbi:MAG: winged helix-turn-helix transcriptional regulator [Enterococcus lacertideformus]|uniref:Winged helix-turn-helix transcriptional regulator n=1 Tax=Enterococcus lacertideformus TaxID=2771493 RepID=A0A931FBA4_9ENTE|nr:winged helix-turn-helix transcriptional regulator [Enterococcus lacertideformus]
MKNLMKLKQDFSDCSQILVALGDEKRQAIIIRLLEDKACKGVRVCDLIEATQLSRPAISHHLKILKDAQIVTYQSVGTKNYYYLTHDVSAINQLKNLIENVTKLLGEE